MYQKPQEPHDVAPLSPPETSPVHPLSTLTRELEFYTFQIHIEPKNMGGYCYLNLCCTRPKNHGEPFQGHMQDQIASLKLGEKTLPMPPKPKGQTPLLLPLHIKPLKCMKMNHRLNMNGVQITHL